MNVTIFKSTDANNSVATFPEGAYHICLKRSNIYNDNNDCWLEECKQYE